ncbi:MAG: class I SAM-dependent methyltransferase [Rhodanobacteraceae bacterium]|nr:MAG: class I SAM-dependent methyltransferase [Rhodanobacteraceae bacterium]
MNDPAMWSRGRLEAVPHCPACGSVRRDPHKFARRDNEGMMPDVWCVVRCADCGSLWLDPRPDSESLPRAYDDYYTHVVVSEDVPDSGATGLAWRLIRGYLNRRFGMQRKPANALGYAIFSSIEPWRLKLDYYGRHLTRANFPNPGTLLDIGCGNGAFLGRAAEMGWNVHGCEPDAKAVSACRQLGLDVVQGDAFDSSLDGREFDVITLSHVIEHVVDAPSLLRRIVTLLRPGGRLWMALPNPGSIGMRVLGSSWLELHPPYHLCIPSQSVVCDWLAAVGFLNVEFIRRGAHAGRRWMRACDIATRESLPFPSSGRLLAWRLAADGLATLSAGSSEETVVIASKPRNKA